MAVWNQQSSVDIICLLSNLFANCALETLEDKAEKELQIFHFRALLGSSYSGEIHVFPIGKVLSFTYSVSWRYSMTNFILKLFSFTPQKYKLCSPLCIESISTLVPQRKSSVLDTRRVQSILNCYAYIHVSADILSCTTPLARMKRTILCSNS